MKKIIFIVISTIAFCACGNTDSDVQHAYDCGREAGYDSGYAEGRKQGIEDGYKEGFDAGLEEGSIKEEQ